MPKMNRRALLKSLAASSIGTAIAPYLRSQTAWAAEPAGNIPLRILFVDVGHGTRRGTFEPVVPGPQYVPQTTALQPSEWDLRPVMSALQPWKSRMTMFDQLDMVSNHEDPLEGANAHIAGSTHMLTAAFRQSDDLSGGISIDQYVAQQLNANGPVTFRPSFECMADEHGEFYAQTWMYDAYSAPGQKVPFLRYIPAAWDFLFPEPLDPDIGQQAALQQRRTSVFNHISGDYNRLLAKLGSYEKTKIQQMLDIRSDLFASMNVVSSYASNRPPESAIMDPWGALNEGYQQGHLGNRLWHHHCRIFSELVGAAFHTDTTRVSTYVIAEPPNYEFGYTAGTLGATDWHDLIHKVSGEQPEVTDPAALAVIDELHTDTYEQVAYLLSFLDSLQEVDGGSVLDHTLVVLYSHIAEGSHDVTRLPWVVIGDAHGALKTGQYIRFPITDLNGQIQLDHADSRTYWRRGRAHNDLFTTIAHAAGVPVAGGHFGQPGLTNSHGLIDEMLA